MKQTPTDKEFIENPANWPRWPYLPVKRQGKDPWPEPGVMIEGHPTVFLINYYQISPEIFKTCKSITYASVDDLLADGWIID